jgi:MFS family permease
VESRAPSARTAVVALCLLTLANLLNFLDRYVVSAVVESLRVSELRLNDTQLGLLMTGFIVVYMLASPLFGRAGDRGRRPWWIAAGVAAWSVATSLGAFARSFGSLLAARSAVGVGEAAYGTIAPALLADSFPARTRGRVFAVFYMAIPVGSAAGYIFGGLVDQRFGWRAAFLLAGAPGLLLAALLSRLSDPPRGVQEGVVVRPSARSAYPEILRNRRYVRIVAGYCAYNFALGALAFWAPAFLERVRGMSRTDATVQLGAILVVTGFAGTFAGGWLGDYVLRRRRGAYLWVSGIATLAAAPVTLVAFLAHTRSVYMAAIALCEVLLFVSTGPINTAIVNAVDPGRRASAVALSILAIHLLGDVPSPPLVGLLSDRTSLGAAMLLLPAFIALGGAVWLYAAWREDRAA